MLVIIATQETEIRMITVQTQPLAKRDAFLKIINTKQGWWSGSSPEFESHYCQKRLHKSVSTNEPTIFLFSFF
jgi:hypothetical protein